jgi:hypothetical protein
MGEKSNANMLFVGKSEEKAHLEDPSIDGRIILKWISNRMARHEVD